MPIIEIEKVKIRISNFRDTLVNEKPRMAKNPIKEIKNILLLV